MEPIPPAPLSSNAGAHLVDGPNNGPGAIEVEAIANNTEATTNAVTSNRSEASEIRAFSTVSSACLACREKHLKCDGLVPCARCIGTQFQCIYVPSRRGARGPRNKRPRSPSSADPGESGLDSCPMFLATPAVSIPASAGPAFSTFTPSIGFGDGQTASRSSSSPSVSHTPNLEAVQVYRHPFPPSGGSYALTTPIETEQPMANIGDRCFDAFYYYFHAAHPFVLPRDHFLVLLKDGTNDLEHLVLAMKYVGSLFIDIGPGKTTFLEHAVRLCYRPTTAKDGFLIQAFLLLILALDGSFEQAKARELLADCERFAVDIGLNTRQFAHLHGRESPVLEESWRRTWWDLYVCDGMIAGVHMVTNFPLFGIEAGAGLPCEELQYLTGCIPTPMYMEDFDDQLFSGEEREFSSFAYRISAIKILGSMMRMPTNVFPDDESVGRVQTMITNWQIHLPQSKKHSLNSSCRLDEMMFQGHFIAHACMLRLHQPMSQLDTSPVLAVTSCAPYHPVASGDIFNVHTLYTITAANEISSMITWPGALLSHTHFFACVVTSSSNVHLCKWAQERFEDHAELREQIRLNIGALNGLSKVWKAAKTASGQVKGTAQKIFRDKKRDQITPTTWVGRTQEQMISSINTDQAIISEINDILSGVTQS